MGDQYITNPSAQQGEPTNRKGSVKEGPVEIPNHPGQSPKASKTKPEENLRDTSPKPMGEKIGRR